MISRHLCDIEAHKCQDHQDGDCSETICLIDLMARPSSNFSAPILSLSLSLAQCPRDLFRPPRTHPGLPRGRACTKTPRKASIFPSLSRLSCQQWLSFVFHCCWDPYTTTRMRHYHFTVEKFWFRRVLSYLGKGWWPQKLQTRSEGDSSSSNAIRNCLLKPIWEGGY